MRVECGPKEGCHGCGGPIPRGRRVWCSNECQNHVIKNHVWGEARSAALKRDGYKCVVCSATKSRLRSYLGKLYGPDHPKAWKEGPLEVNHIQPVNGRRRSVDCQNHQDNLETLCHDCHVSITKQQREAGLLVGTVRHWIQILRLPAGVTIFCVRCAVTVEPRDWARMKREECPAGTKKSQKKPLRKSRKRR